MLSAAKHLIQKRGFFPAQLPPALAGGKNAQEKMGFSPKQGEMNIWSDSRFRAKARGTERAISQPPSKDGGY